MVSAFLLAKYLTIVSLKRSSSASTKQILCRYNSSVTLIFEGSEPACLFFFVNTDGLSAEFKIIN